MSHGRELEAGPVAAARLDLERHLAARRGEAGAQEDVDARPGDPVGAGVGHQAAHHAHAEHHQQREHQADATDRAGDRLARVHRRKVRINATSSASTSGWRASSGRAGMLALLPAEAPPPTMIAAICWSLTDACQAGSP